MSLASRIIVMDEGTIQQVGSPTELYHEPVNRFVAGFIGSPSMNFFEGTVTDGGLEVFGTSVPSSALAERADRLTDVELVTVGVRPETFTLDGDAAVTFTATLKEKEPLGAKALLHGEVDGEPFVLRTRQRPSVGRGDEFDVGVAPADLYLFDPSSGEVID